MHEMYIIKSGPKRVGRKGWAENITGPKTKVGRKETYPFTIRYLFMKEFIWLEAYIFVS